MSRGLIDQFDDYVCDYITGAETRKTVTLTRVNNSYVNATSFARCSCSRYGHIGVLRFNISPSTSIPANQTAFFQIGTMSPAPLYEVVQVVPSQNGGSPLTVYIAIDGSISLINGGSAASGTAFRRASIPLLFA